MGGPKVHPAPFVAWLTMYVPPVFTNEDICPLDEIFRCACRLGVGDHAGWMRGRFDRGSAFACTNSDSFRLVVVESEYFVRHSGLQHLSSRLRQFLRIVLKDQP